MFRLPRFFRIVIYIACAAMIFALGLSSMHTASAKGKPIPSLINTQTVNQSTLNLRNGTSLPSIYDSTFSSVEFSLSILQGQMIGYATKLFVLLVGLDAFWMTAVFLLQKDNIAEFISQLVVKIITVCFLYFVVVEHGPDLATLIIGSFAQAASTANANITAASGTTVISVSPTDILAEGLGFAAVPVAEASLLGAIPDEVLGNGATQAVSSEIDLLVAGAIGIFGVFSGIAAEITIATIEMYVVLNLGIILTGFLGSRWTEKYGQGYVSFAINAGVRYFFVIIMIGIIYPIIINAAAFQSIPIVGPVYFSAIALACAAVIHAVPGFAASALSGQSSASGAQMGQAFAQAAQQLSDNTRGKYKEVKKAKQEGDAADADKESKRQEALETSKHREAKMDVLNKIASGLQGDGPRNENHDSFQPAKRPSSSNGKSNTKSGESAHGGRSNSGGKDETASSHRPGMSSSDNAASGPKDNANPAQGSSGAVPRAQEGAGGTGPAPGNSHSPAQSNEPSTNGAHADSGTSASGGASASGNGASGPPSASSGTRPSNDPGAAPNTELGERADDRIENESASSHQPRAQDGVTPAAAPTTLSSSAASPSTPNSEPSTSSKGPDAMGAVGRLQQNGSERPAVPGATTNRPPPSESPIEQRPRSKSV